jgi:hypothetical protein
LLIIMENMLIIIRKIRKGLSLQKATLVN